jgi:hypothetical protein
VQPLRELLERRAFESTASTSASSHAAGSSPYRAMPRPGVVVGDQVAADGLLARRLGYTFLHYRPQIASMPTGPRLLFGFGDLLRPLLFSSDHNPGQPR